MAVSFLLNTSLHLRGLLAGRMGLEAEKVELYASIDQAVTVAATIESTVAAQGLLGECVRQHMGSEEGRRETAGLVEALLSLGVPVPLTSLPTQILLAEIATMNATPSASAEAQ